MAKNVKKPVQVKVPEIIESGYLPPKKNDKKPKK